MSRDYGHMTWSEAGEAAVVPAILPLGATEQHGPHLPLTVDTTLADGVAKALAAATGGVVLPPVNYGDAWNNEAFAGTISLPSDLLRQVILAIGRGAQRIGHPALITLNGHFGNKVAAAEAAETLAAEGLPVLNLDYPGLEVLASDICESAPAGDHFYHADEVETSMMLALDPGAVRMGAAAPEYPTFPADFGTRPMQLRSFNDTGVFGDPRPATAAKGTALIDGIVANCLPEVAAFCRSHGLEVPPWQR